MTRKSIRAFGFVLVAVFGVGLAACPEKNQGPTITPAEATLLGCEAYAAALNTLASLVEAGKINAATREIVVHARATGDPLCLGPAPDVNATVRDIAIDGAVRTLDSIAQSFQ